eukprot:gene12100-16192_t
MTGSPTSPQKDNVFRPSRTVMDAFNHSSWFPKDPEVTFGSSSRPPLNSVSGGPGPGAYPIKTTMGKIHESHIRSPAQYTIRGRTKFGDPNEKSLSKTSANEPGPGQYDLTNKFLSGTNPRKTAFPKASIIRDKSQMGPGPGSYQPLQSLGKQILSTTTEAPKIVFGKADRPSMVQPGLSDVGPGEYKPPPAACDTQVDSRKPTCANIKFGEGYKKGSKHNKFDFSEPTPGPGAYVLPGGIATKAKGSPFRDSPAITISGREKFGSPW